MSSNGFVLGLSVGSHDTAAALVRDGVGRQSVTTRTYLRPATHPPYKNPP